MTTLDNGPSRTLAVVVGHNCRRIRTAIGITQDELAVHAKNVGLRWNAAKAANFEAGRFAAPFATILAVTLALQSALQKTFERRGEIPDWGVTLADLLVGAGNVQLTEGCWVPAYQLEAVCRKGQAIGPAEVITADAPARVPIEASASAVVVGDHGIGTDLALAQFAATDPVSNVLKRSGLAEHRLANRLGIAPNRLAAISLELWRSTFTEERDRRAGLGANQQKKGRISRELRAELEEALTDGIHQ